MTGLSIGEVARRSGIAVSAIRHYEEVGLLPRPQRMPNNRRCYDLGILETLTFVAACRHNGMGLPAIRNLQRKLSGNAQHCEEARAILDAAVKETSMRIAELQAARRHLSKVASACGADLCGDSCSISTNMNA